MTGRTASRSGETSPSVSTDRVVGDRAMQKVLIDKFIVPEESKAAFRDVSRTIQGVLKTLPGFVEGFVYEKREGDSRETVMTTAVWESEHAFAAAKTQMAVELRRLGIDPPDVMKNLKVQIERGVYDRSPY
jgi:heme-degrading monooxygenase HmoA